MLRPPPAGRSIGTNICTTDISAECGRTYRAVHVHPDDYLGVLADIKASRGARGTGGASVTSAGTAEQCVSWTLSSSFKWPCTCCCCVLWWLMLMLLLALAVNLAGAGRGHWERLLPYEWPPHSTSWPAWHRRPNEATSGSVLSVGLCRNGRVRHLCVYEERTGTWILVFLDWSSGRMHGEVKCVGSVLRWDHRHL